MSLLSTLDKDKLLALRAELPKYKAAEPIYKPVVEGERYLTTRYKVTLAVYIHEVGRDSVKIKTDPKHQDSKTISRAKLDKYYVLDEGGEK